MGKEAGVVYGVGVSDVIPVGYYNEDGKWRSYPWYIHWNGMLRRVYGDKAYLNRSPSYKYVTICAAWLLASNFKLWYDEYNVLMPKELGVVQLDKDLLVLGCKEYSPVTSRLVPRKLNNIFINTNNKVGELPVGVHYAPNHANGVRRLKPYTTQVQLGAVGKRSCTRWETVSEAEADYNRLKLLQVKTRVAECTDYVCPDLLVVLLKRGEELYGNTR
tara:strand:+ start:3040 stop:3690 length:651 start_codon:yes stop_codon:yes gene_type:complete